MSRLRNGVRRLLGARDSQSAAASGSSSDGGGLGGATAWSAHRLIRDGRAAQRLGWDRRSPDRRVDFLALRGAGRHREGELVPSLTAGSATGRPLADVVDLTQRFKLEAKLGNGGFGEVWRARDLQLRRTVAIKLMEPSGSGGPAISGALEHAQALARVSHPNVVRIYDLGSLAHPETGELWDAIVMELLDGPSLAELLTGEMPREQAEKFCNGLVDGLEALHRAGIAHSDLHDENIMLHDGVLKILDALYRGTLDGVSQVRRQLLLGADVMRLRNEISRILACAGMLNTEVLFRRLSRDAADVLSLREAFDQTSRNAPPADPDQALRPSGAAPHAADIDTMVRAITERNISAIPSLPALRALTGDDRVVVKRAVTLVPENQGHGGHSPSSREVPIEEVRLLSDDLDRCVIFGDGGGGKSTLLVCLAQRFLNDPTITPLLVNIAEASEGETLPRSLVELLAQYITVRAQVSLPRANLERALRGDRFVLLLDGLDEIHDRKRLKSVVAMLIDFATFYKSCRIAVTARPWVDSETSLSRSVFTRVRLAPLSREAIRELVCELAVRVETRGVVARRADDIVGFILEHSDLQDLAGSPLLCTLMALIGLHLHEPNYSSRTRIYGRCLDLLLLEWSQDSGRQADGNDVELSSQLLQYIALQMHESGVDWLSKEAMIDECIAFFGARGGPARIDALRWWRWQREEIGLLQEDGHGRVRFFHRSFQDFLAAEAILSRNGGDLDALLDRIHHEYAQRKHDVLCFLMTAPRLPVEFVDRSMSSLLDLRPSFTNTEQEYRGWGLLAFLIQLLQGGAEISDSMFDRVMDDAARASLEHCNKFFHDVGNIKRWQQMLASVYRRGHCHYARISRWFETRLLGDDLELRYGALWTRPPEISLPASVLEHSAAARALAAGRDLGILHPFGQWAQQNMTWEGLALWSRSIPVELVLGRCLEAWVHRWDPWLRELSVALFRRMQWYGQMTFLALRSGAEAASSTEMLVWKQGQQVFVNRLWPALIPLRAYDTLEPRLRKHFELESNWEADHGLIHCYVEMLDRSFGGAAAKSHQPYLKEYFAHDYGLTFGPSGKGWTLPPSITHVELRNPTRELSQRLAFPIWVRLFNQQRVSYKLLCGEELFSGESLWLERGDLSDVEQRPHASGWGAILAASTKSELASESHRMLLEQLAEVHTGALPAVLLAGDDPPGSRARTVYVDLRVQNRWLLHHLDGIAAAVPSAERTPSMQSMLLALTLAQYQTTWSFPNAGWWTDLLAEEPQDDLAKALWHLAHAAHGGLYQKNLETAAECIARGCPSMFPSLCIPLPTKTQ